MSKPLVKVTFLDHYQADATSLRPVECTVIGTLAKEDDKCIYILTWIYEDEYENHNSDGYCLIKSTIVSLVELEEKKYDPKDAIGHKGSKSDSKGNSKQNGSR